MSTFPIDAVIAWVDGNDPQHKAKRMHYASPDQKLNDEVGGDIRFTSIGEIKYAVASILRFAPFVRTIYMVTDNQNPNIDEFVERNFPNRTTNIEIVDHRVLFRDYEEVLPTFNSRSIETVLWRIPNLSEYYVYFNDDVMLARPLSPSDFFDADGRIMCYASHFSVPFAALLRKIKPKKKGFKVSGFKDAMLNAARVIGEKYFFPYPPHIPHAQRKSILQTFFTEHPDLFVQNLTPRFRASFQFNPQVLCYMLGKRQGKAIQHSKTGVYLYLKPKKDNDYMRKKLAQFTKDKGAKFVCFNSLDYASKEDQQLAIQWLENRLSLC